MEHPQQSNTTRRNFLAAGTAGLALAALAPGETATAESILSDSGKATEKANEDLVMQLCKDISAVDPAKLAHLLADDFVFQLIDGTPLIEGKEKFLGFVGTFFAPFERAEFIVHRSHALGNLVINERHDLRFQRIIASNQFANRIRPPHQATLFGEIHFGIGRVVKPVRQQMEMRRKGRNAGGAKRLGLVRACSFVLRKAEPFKTANEFSLNRHFTFVVYVGHKALLLLQPAQQNGCAPINKSLGQSRMQRVR